MTTRDPGAAVAEAVASYLSSALAALSLPPAQTGVTVIRGWPETDKDVDLAVKPTLAVYAVPGGAESIASPHTLGDVAAGAVTVGRAMLAITVQMDLFAAYRETMDVARAAVDAALANDLPWRPHLYLAASDYYSRPFVVTKLTDVSEIDGETAQRGEWRATWTLRADIERVASVTMTAASEIDTPLTT